MKTLKNVLINTLLAVTLLSLVGCAGMTAQGRNTAIGAGVGAGVGAALTGGSALGTLGGAAGGGIVGHEITK